MAKKSAEGYSYYELINTFETYIRAFPLNSHARSLWYRLAWEWNRAFFSARPLVFREEELRCPINMNHRQFIDARKVLVEGHFLNHIRRKGSQAAMYQLHYLPVSLNFTDPDPNTLPAATNSEKEGEEIDGG